MKAEKEPNTTESHGSLTGQVALVCGATGSLGAAITRYLARRGASVALQFHTRRDVAEALRGELPFGPHVILAADLADRVATAETFEAIVQTLGAHPTIVVNAASPPLAPAVVAQLADEDMELAWQGFRMHVNVCSEAVVGMREIGSGRIVLVSAALAARYACGFALYSAMKAGLTAFSHTLALEEGKFGITVNVVAPGRVTDDEAASELPPAYALLDSISRMRMALPEYPTPKEVAHVVGFLASREAGAVTGQVVYVAGGEPI